MKTIRELCKWLNSKHYFVDGEGLVGVPYCGHINWYRLIPLVGYSMTGQTQTPCGAQLRKLEDKNAKQGPALERISGPQHD